MALFRHLGDLDTSSMSLSGGSTFGSDFALDTSSTGSTAGDVGLGWTADPTVISSGDITKSVATPVNVNSAPGSSWTGAQQAAVTTAGIQGLAAITAAALGAKVVGVGSASGYGYGYGVMPGTVAYPTTTAAMQAALAQQQSSSSTLLLLGGLAIVVLLLMGGGSKRSAAPSNAPAAS